MILDMKKMVISLCAVLLMVTTSGCTTGLLGNGTSTTSTSGTGLGGVLGGVLGGIVGSQNTMDGLLGLVIGSIKISESELYGTWYYTEPGCAFTSENLLAKAGGSVAAENCKEKLLPVYNSLGIAASNTQFVFTQDHKFSGKMKGIPMSGSYDYNPSSGTIKLKALLFSTNAYVTRTNGGLALTFESKNLLKVLQAVAAVSGNSTLQTVGELSKQYDGVRLGFEMAK